MMRRLLEGVCEREQIRLRERAPQHLHTYRHPIVGESSGDRDGGKCGPPTSCDSDSGTIPLRLESRASAAVRRGCCAPRDSGWSRTCRSPSPPPRNSRDRRASTAARAPGISRRVVGIARLAAEQTDRRDAACELVQVGLADDDRAGVAQLPHLKPVALGHRALERGRAGGRRRIGRVVVVFQDDRNAVERTAGAARRALPIQRCGLRQRVGFNAMIALIAGPR